VSRIAPRVEPARIGARVTIETPEGVPITFALASPAERLFAYALDVALSQVLTIIVVIALVVAATASVSEILLAMALVGYLLFRHVYFLFFETRMHGGTPGKRLLGLRVVRRDGGPLDLSAVVTRTVLREIEVTVPIVMYSAPEQFIGRAPPWLTVLAMAWVLVMLAIPVLSREGVRVGDLVAGTVVVRIPKLALKDDQGRLAQGKQLVFTARHLGHYGEKELETLADLLRVRDAGRASDEDLAQVAEAICKRVGLPPAVAGDPERFLREFYRAQRAELEGRLVLGERIADKNQR
jgi:uncharacterized RDD family membrane protein YckC